MRKTLARVVIGAAAAAALAGAAVTPALASTAAPAVRTAPAPPVKVTAGPDIGGTTYYILSNAYEGTYLTHGSGPVGRMALSGSADGFKETQTAPYSYDGVKWYQWQDTITGYCIQAVGSGNAYPEEATCNGSDENQFFYNNALTASEFLSLSSTVYAGKNYGMQAETSAAVSINSYSNVAKYHWNFET